MYHIEKLASYSYTDKLRLHQTWEDHELGNYNINSCKHYHNNIMIVQKTFITQARTQGGFEGVRTSPPFLAT